MKVRRRKAEDSHLHARAPRRTRRYPGRRRCLPGGTTTPLAGKRPYALLIAQADKDVALVASPSSREEAVKRKEALSARGPEGPAPQRVALGIRETVRYQVAHGDRENVHRQEALGDRETVQHREPWVVPHPSG